MILFFIIRFSLEMINIKGKMNSLYETFQIFKFPFNQVRDGNGLGQFAQD